MENRLISRHTKSWKVGYQFIASDPAIGTVIVDDYAIIQQYGQEPREYRVYPHKGCENGGLKFYTMEAYSNQGRCTGCDLNEYNGIGD